MLFPPIVIGSDKLIVLVKCRECAIPGDPQGQLITLGLFYHSSGFMSAKESDPLAQVIGPIRSITALFIQIIFSAFQAQGSIQGSTWNFLPISLI
jgi:hypothetical protein